MTSPRTALVVDGDTMILSMLSNILRDAGFVTSCERTGKAGTTRLSKQSFDVVLINTVLSDMSGLWLCSFMREHFGYRSVVCMLSAASQANLRVTALQVGADDFIVFPFDTEEFVLRIKSKLR